MERSILPTEKIAASNRVVIKAIVGRSAAGILNMTSQQCAIQHDRGHKTQRM